MNKSGKRNKLLTAAVLATLLATPAYGYAFKQAPVYVDYSGRHMAELQFLSQGEGVENQVSKADFTLDPALAASVVDSTRYWVDILGLRAKNQQPWQIFVRTTKNEQNASASSTSFDLKNEDPKETNLSYVAMQIQDGKKLGDFIDAAIKDDIKDGAYAYSDINIGQYMGGNRKGAVEGWWMDADTVLPTNEQATDFVGTFRHELGHALGIGKAVDYIDENGKPYTPQTDEEIIKSKTTGEAMMKFALDATDPRLWNQHLVDQNLNPAKPGMVILSSKGFAEEKKKNPKLQEKDFFIVNNTDNEESSEGRNGKAFFVGKNVTDALAGATFFGVSGVPVNGWEDTSFEGSHLQTSGMMSHRSYSNYAAFMEVELAVMQDLGYDLDRKAYFGYSVYGDGKTINNTQGYSARNAEGTAYVEGKASAVPLGIGLHIYGSRNNVTQAADILTVGTGGTGVRVDGMQNTLVIPKSTKIQADGLRGNGILIAYGRDQVIDQAGSVTANGKGGTGIRFDFGSSTNGATDEYRGSYIRFKRTVEEGTGEIISSENLNLTDMDSSQYNAGKDELNGPLVKEYNLSGSLSGAENAIYIARNAFVKDINIKDGASISGNITSDWKHFNTDGSYDGATKTETERIPKFDVWMEEHHPTISVKDFFNLPEAEQKKLLDEYESDPNVKTKTVTQKTPALLLQYNGKTGSDGYAYDAYIPDLVTDLNFNATMAYNGNITGPDNMKLHVNGGTLVYGGKADVVGVTVAQGATLLGGSYTVHDMSDKVAEDFEDRLTVTDTGNFVSHGTIGAMSNTTSMRITGKLISDGTLQGMAGGDAGTIEVSGAAVIDGSNVTAQYMLPDETFTVLKANAVSGSVANTEDAPYKFGMLDEIGAVNGNTAEVSSKAANNLGATDATQAETYGAMMAMYNNLTAAGDDRRNEMRPLFTLSPEEAKEALSAISSNAAAKSMALAQRSTLTQHILSTRLTEAFATKDVSVTIPVQKLDDGAGDGVPVSVKAVEPAEDDIWLKFGKNWGDMRNDVDYHSSATLLGWDKAYGKNWRAGVFAGYGTTGFADRTAGNELRDTRVGIYAGYSRDKSEGMVFVDYGWMRNKLHRGVMGQTARARYHSRLLEAGGEYRYDLQGGQNKTWHTRPYVNAQISRLWQDGYSEEGAGIYGQDVSSKNNDYIAMGAGVEFKRYLAGGSYAARVGVKHAFTGADPKLRYGYLGDSANTYEMRNVQDKTHYLLSVGGEVAFGKGWTVGGDAAFERGRHDKDWSCSVTVKRTW